MDLNDTVELMNSDKYSDRFIAEYRQLKIRYDRLNMMLQDYDNGRLDFNPITPINILKEQLEYMKNYLDILELRSKVEDIEL